MLKYLARYTHRVAISNARLLSLEDDRVSFRYKDYADGGRERTMVLEAAEFLRRFLQHVLPSGFVRVRHSGFLANGCRRAKLALCRELLGGPGDSEVVSPVERSEVVSALAAPVGGGLCPHCGKGRMVVVGEVPPVSGRRRVEVPPVACVIFDSS